MGHLIQVSHTPGWLNFTLEQNDTWTVDLILVKGCRFVFDSQCPQRKPGSSFFLQFHELSYVFQNTSFWIKLPVSLDCLQTKKSKSYGTWISVGIMVLKKGSWMRSQKTLVLVPVLLWTATVYVLHVAVPTVWRFSPEEAYPYHLGGILKPRTLISHASSVESLSFPLCPPMHCLTIENYRPVSLQY